MLVPRNEESPELFLQENRPLQTNLAAWADGVHKVELPAF
jgi:hypothetical protein